MNASGRPVRGQSRHSLYQRARLRVSVEDAGRRQKRRVTQRVNQDVREPQQSIHDGPEPPDARARDRERHEHHHRRVAVVDMGTDAELRQHERSERQRQQDDLCGRPRHGPARDLALARTDPRLTSRQGSRWTLSAKATMTATQARPAAPDNIPIRTLGI